MVAQDLSHFDRPVGNLIRLPQSAAEWQRYRLSDEQLAFFREQGYLKGVRALDGMPDRHAPR